MIRAEIESWKGEKKWAEYSIFHVSGEIDNYKLTVGGYNESSTAPDQMCHDNGWQCTTKDRDNNELVEYNCNCVNTLVAGGGWWHSSNICSKMLPTGLFGGEEDSDVPYMAWPHAFDGKAWQAVKSHTMMIKPNDEQ